MTLKANNRIISYLMNSDFETPVVVTIQGAVCKAIPAIYHRQVGVIHQQNGMFIAGRYLEKLEV